MQVIECTIVFVTLLGVQGKIVPIGVGVSQIQHVSPVGEYSSEQDATVPETEFAQFCPLTPRISIVSYSRQEFLPNATVKTELIGLTQNEDEKVLLAPFAATVEVECVAAVPIQWTFDGPQEPEVLSIDVAREIEGDQEWDQNGKSCFRLVMKLITRKRSTGRYRCTVIGSVEDVGHQHKTQSSVYLYAEVNGPPFLLYAEIGREFNVVQAENSATVVLPCQSVNPTVIPELIKGSSSVATLNGAVSYDPQVGFTLPVDSSKIPEPFDQYKCTREGGYVRVNVKPLPEFRVRPARARLSTVEGIPLTLSCEAVFPIALVGFIDESKATIIKNENAVMYKYKVTYDYYLHGQEPTGISCIDLKTRSTLHTWTSTLITLKAEQESGIRYDKDTKRFYCFSKTASRPSMALVQCNSIMECQLARKCLSWDAPFTLTNGGNICYSEEKVQRQGNNCVKEDVKQFASVENRGCTYIGNTLTDLDAGLVQCKDNGETTEVYYFTGVKSGSDVVITDWNTGAGKELIDIQTLEPNRTFYTEESIEFECAVPKFVFARGQIFRFKLDNGSYIIPEETVRDADDGEDSLIVKTSKLKITSDKIKEVVCISPFWNQTGWMNNSLRIRVVASVQPVIFHRQSFMFAETGKNVSVACEAVGLPAPKVTWYRNGKRAENQWERLNSSNTSKVAVLVINPVNPDDSGDYTCEAVNAAGTAKMNLNLDVFQSKRGLHLLLMAGGVVLTAFFTVVVILWRKLRKNQAIVRRLTKKEEDEFFEGDVNARRNPPDGYIRAQYLPYDKQYEIKKENLEINPNEVLGNGEYGIVLKATLCLNDCRKLVAVKTSRTQEINHCKALMTELKMLTYIGWHDNVIHLLGAVTRNIREGDVYVVIEYCRLGDLEKFLKANRSSFLDQIVNDRIDLNVNFSFNSEQAYQPVEYTIRTFDLISWSYQISSAMEYLSSRKVIHGDLAARNVLLTEDRTVKITDFGLSKHLYNGTNYVSHSNNHLPWKHCAPETLCQTYSTYSTQSDVWAMGVTLWEIYSLGSVPYQGIGFNSDFKSKLLEGLRLEKPCAANQDIYNVMLKCWKNTPAERISFEELRRYFHRLLHHWAEEETSDDSDDVNIPLRKGAATLQPQPKENHYVTNPSYQPMVHYNTAIRT